MKKINKFSYPEVLARSFERSDLVAPFFPQDAISLGEIEQKLRLLKTMTWSSSETDTFWSEVHTFKDITGNYPFRVLSTGVIKMLCLPASNAEIERVYSQVTEVKSKKRASLHTELLEAILYCKFGLTKFGVAVDEFDPPRQILNYNSDIYN